MTPSELFVSATIFLEVFKYSIRFPFIQKFVENIGVRIIYWDSTL